MFLYWSKPLSDPTECGLIGAIINSGEFKFYDATVAKTSFKVASSSFSIYSVIMSVCLTFES